jgi:LPS-assembly protein
LIIRGNDRPNSVNLLQHARITSATRLLLVSAVVLISVAGSPGGQAHPQQARLPTAKGQLAELSSSGPQRRQGDLYIADGDVVVRYGDSRLTADHVEYNDATSEVAASGHVHYDFENQHLEADDAHYNVSTGHGTFHRVRGTVKIVRQPNPTILISDNPLYFQAEEAERLGPDVYVIRKAWVTICEPEHPSWQFFAAHAHVQLNDKIALVSANFRLFRVPLLWIPYATAPAAAKVRQSGFLIPDVGDSSLKGVIFGDAFYWAPAPWMDATLGAQYFSRRGASEHGQFRARPNENTSISYTYFGVDDRGLDIQGVRQPQGGEEQRLEIQSILPGGWRFVTDYNQLSSLTFRLAFADTFGEAINSEVRSAVFASKNYRGFSFNIGGLNDKSFLTLPSQVPPFTPATSVTLRNLPELRVSSVDQSLWNKLPFYFSFDGFVGATHRSDQFIDTAKYVSRAEFAPRVTLPVHFGHWFDVAASATFRTTRYGASLDNSGPTPVVIDQAIVRNTGEFAIDLRPPTLERYFDRPKKNRRYKHTIEPSITYRYVTGVNNFADFIRFDSDATLTNTNEVEYGFTQRLYVKQGDDQPQELISWSIEQKHYFDPTFGGAIVAGDRNVFQALNSITPFAFALGPVNWSPIVSDFKITPGGIYDFEQILDYDPNLQRMTTIGELLKIKPYREFFATIAEFRLDASPVLQPLANQVRLLLGYGAENRKGFNFTTGLSYDFQNHQLQSQLVQATYNGGCCGLSVEYRRLALGQIRTENQFRVAFIIANIGNFGNLRRQEKIF